MYLSNSIYPSSIYHGATLKQPAMMLILDLGSVFRATTKSGDVFTKPTTNPPSKEWIRETTDTTTPGMYFLIRYNAPKEGVVLFFLRDGAVYNALSHYPRVSTRHVTSGRFLTLNGKIFHSVFSYMRLSDFDDFCGCLGIA